MKISHIQEQSKIYGPGNRFVIWVQGCSLRCPGCWNPEMWSAKAGLEKSIDEILIQIKSLENEIEGVTFLGGEPLEQYADIKYLCEAIKEIGLSTMLFTGYTMHDIKEKQQTKILSYLDILITGRYDENLRNTQLQWIGSSNQEILFLSKEYNDYNIQNTNYVEIHLANDGQAEVLGFPEDDWL